MLASPRIFVSHSSLDNTLTEDLCHCLEFPDDSQQPAYQVLVDYTELVAGKPWPKQIHEYMARCDAAVILLTENAVPSPWVLKEATILAWRLALDKNFHLFTIRFPKVTDKMLEKEKYSPLLLEQIQQINSYDPEAIAQKIRDTIGLPKRKNTPFDKLVGRLTDLFTKVGKNTLQEVAETISIDPPQWKPDQDKQIQYVEEIARHIICESLGGYNGIDDFVEVLSLSTSAETVKQIMWIVAPRWVDAEAAGKLAPLPKRSPRRAAVMNGAKVSDFTAPMYVRRAHPLSRRYRVIQTAGGFPGDLVEHFTNEICDWVRKRENRCDDNETIIEDLAKRKPTLYVVLPTPLPPGVSLRTLLDRFPKLSFILWTGEALERDESRHDVDWLTPETDLDLEEKEQQCCLVAEDIIQSMTEF